MKAIALLLTLVLAQGWCPAENGDLRRARELYYKASANKSDAELFNDFLHSSPDVEKTLLSGYRGMSYMIMANYTWNPYNKLSFFNKGKALLDEAIRKDPANMELRFLRFGVQTNAPGFLGYSGMIAEDKAVIINGYPQSKDGDLKNRIKNYLINSKYCSASDKAVLNR